MKYQHANAKPNSFEIRGSDAIVVLRRRNGDLLEAIIDLADLDKVKRTPRSWYPWTYGNTTYARNDAVGYLHAFVMGKPPRGFVVDHRDRNGLNNRRSNLRVIKHARNLLNRSKFQAASGYRGVYFDPRVSRWEAKVKVDGRVRFLGMFDDPAKANEVVQAAIAEILAEAERAGKLLSRN